MIDAHVHLEGNYSSDNLKQYIAAAESAGIDELWLLEHTHLFLEFLPLYDAIGDYSDPQAEWIEKKKRNAISLDNYRAFISDMRKEDFPVKLRFGLECCYLPGCEAYYNLVKKDGFFDFLTGAVHYIDGFAFSFERYRWEHKDKNHLYRRYYESSIDMVSTGLFDVIAHPDYISCYGYLPTTSIKELYKGLASACKETDTAAENSAGLLNNYGTKGFPLPELYEYFSIYDVPLLAASDAHIPENIGNFR